jgi:phage-related protein
MPGADPTRSWNGAVLHRYIQSSIFCIMKSIRFLGDSLESLREFPDDARQDAGYQLDQIQRGMQPTDFKPMPSVGKGVEELRVRDESGAFRVIYIARLPQAVFVLHAFQKKTRTTARKDIEIARERHADLMRDRR